MLTRRDFVRTCGVAFGGAAAGAYAKSSEVQSSDSSDSLPPEDPATMPTLVTDFTPTGTSLVLPDGNSLFAVSSFRWDKTDPSVPARDNSSSSSSFTVFLSPTDGFKCPGKKFIKIHNQCLNGSLHRPYCTVEGAGRMPLEVVDVTTHFDPNGTACMLSAVLHGKIPMRVSVGVPSTYDFIRCRNCNNCNQIEPADCFDFVMSDRWSDGSVHFSYKAWGITFPAPTIKNPPNPDGDLLRYEIAVETAARLLIPMPAREIAEKLSEDNEFNDAVRFKMNNHRQGFDIPSGLTCRNCGSLEGRWFKESFILDQLTRLYVDGGCVSLGFGPLGIYPWMSGSGSGKDWISACPYVTHRYGDWSYPVEPVGA